jgi:hypothetical protein
MKLEENLPIVGLFGKPTLDKHDNIGISDRQDK